MRFIFTFCVLCFLSTASIFSQNYWQQKINYKMDVNLDVKTNILSGNQTITYYNNSPDTLKELYFHLYWNAFKKGSYMQLKSDRVKRSTGELIEALKKDEEGNVNIKSIKIKKRLLKWDEHDTVLRLLLDEPLAPNSSVIIEVEFVSQVPLLTRRAGRDNQQGIRYSMAQWYPKVAEYDSEGWHHYEYAGREFYGVWGDFDVNITLNSKYIVASSGEIQNPEEVKCGYELGRVDTTILNPNSSTFSRDSLKTWHFRAENVHDFAWAADDKFIHDITYWDNVTIHSLYIPSYQDKWKKVKNYAQAMLDFYSTTYGKYPYKTFTVVQAGDGGMEYPTIIFNAGWSPGLMAHEGGHQWFYGLLGNNESKEGWLDEGIITYTTDKNTTESFNYPIRIEPESGLNGIFQLPYDQHSNYRSYWNFSNLGIEEPMLTHSDLFKDDMTYSFGTYVKGSFIPIMLEYVIGDSVFDRFMKRYFDEWHFKHPHSSDFQRLAEKESGMELDWFFDEWLRTTKTCDYAVNSFSGKWIQENSKNKYRISCELENRDDIVMPIDLQINFTSGKTQKAIIPVEWNSKQEKGSLILPRWKWVDKNYSFTYDFDEEVESVEIDPSLRMKDLNRLNNKSGFLPKFDVNFIRPIQFYPPIDEYWITYRPTLWYSVPDGMRLGILERGGYMGSSYINPLYENKIGLWYLTKSNQVDYDLSFSFPIKTTGKLSSFTFSASKINGIKSFGINFDKVLTPWYPYMDKKKNIGFYYKFQQLVENDLPFSNIFWDKGITNKLGFVFNFENSNSGITKFTTNMEVTFGSIANYSRVKFEYIQNFDCIPFNFRAFAGFTTVTPPAQDKFYLSSANPSEAVSNPFYRSIYFLNNNAPSDIYLNMAGGGNISSKLNENITGRNLISFSIETKNASLDDIGIDLPVLSLIRANLYSNLSNIWDNEYAGFKSFIDDFYVEGGFSLSLSLFRSESLVTGIISDLKDVNIRFNAPLFLNRVYKNEKYFDWRWNISIGKVINL